MELMPGLNLHRGQRHRRAIANAMEGDLLNVSQNNVKASIDEGATGIDGIHSCVCHKLERLQLHR